MFMTAITQSVINHEKLLDIYQNTDQNSAYCNIVAKLDGKIIGFATVIINYDIVEELKSFLTI